MNLVKYKRVSGATQASDGEGFEVQDRALDAWAAANGHTFVASCEDVITGKTDLEARPGLSCAMGTAKELNAGVAFWKLDRLARDLIQQELILAEFKRAGIAVFSTIQAENDVMTDDAKDPSRTFVRQILGAVSQYERALISLRMAGGKAVKKSKGGRTDGQTPYGWKTIGKGQLIADENEAETLAEVRGLKARNYTLRAIAKELEAAGRTTRAGKAAWSPSTIASLLRQPLRPAGS